MSFIAFVLTPGFPEFRLAGQNSANSAFLLLRSMLHHHVQWVHSIDMYFLPKFLTLNLPVLRINKKTLKRDVSCLIKGRLQKKVNLTFKGRGLLKNSALFLLSYQNYTENLPFCFLTKRKKWIDFRADPYNSGFSQSIHHSLLQFCPHFFILDPISSLMMNNE